jgi:hypothetical protein
VVVALSSAIFLTRGGIGAGGGIVELPNGESYTTEEYFKLVNEGNSPMNNY